MTSLTGTGSSSNTAELNAAEQKYIFHVFPPLDQWRMTAVMDENKCVYMCKCVRSYQEQEHDKIKTSISHLNAFKYFILFTSSDQAAYELVKCALSMLVITIMHLQYLVDLNIMQHKGNKLVH